MPEINRGTIGKNARKTEDIDIDALRKAVAYEPDTGLVRHIHASGNRPAGAGAGSINNSGYITVRALGMRLQAHRVAWLLMTGGQVNGFIDHINGNRSDNRWSNLRWANRANNAMNRIAALRNAAGFKGVVQRGDRWAAYIKLDGAQTYLGSYQTPAEAAAAYDGAARILFKEFALTNAQIKERAA